ncbi:MAG TPA: hypothetical protein VF313_01560 [Anaerolineaceae bacterium]
MSSPASRFHGQAGSRPRICLMMLSVRPATLAFARQPGYRRNYEAALLVIRLGSAFYNAPLTFVSQFLDVKGIFLLISFAGLYILLRLGRLVPYRLLLVYLVVNLLRGNVS